MSNYHRWVYVEDDVGSTNIYIQATVVYNNVVCTEMYSIRIFKNLNLTVGYYYYKFTGLVKLSKEAINYLLKEYDIKRILKESELE
uniref:Uncharacterized protein n=1 Tax=Siphoviridae sp. ctWWc42 TaxID=2826361 RepID=A0A8S5R2B5_9CAUD|nr:MAG TPA: hypothetical protein [Siphoviridae sp. ctWWc42]